MDPELIALLNYLLSQGYLGPQSMQTGGFVIPQDYDDGGLPMGGPSTTQARGLTFADNYNSYLADPMTGAQVGGSAFDRGQFQPIIEREEVELPGQRMLNQWLSKREGTLENLIAQEIASGGSAASAFAYISQILNGTAVGPEAEALKPMLERSIPPRMIFDEVSQTSVNAGPDLGWVMDRAQALDDAIASDPYADEYDEMGRGYRVSETPSPMMEKFASLGLPSPYDEYSVDAVMGPQWTANRQNLADLQGGIYSEGARQNADRRAATEAERIAMGRVVMPEQPLPEPLQAVERWLRPLMPNEGQAAAPAPDQGGGSRGGLWRLFGDEADNVARYTTDPLAGAGRSVVNTLLGDESPLKDDRGSPSRRRSSAGAASMTSAANAKRKVESAESATAKRKQVRQEPSATMNAYRNFVKANKQQFGDDWSQAYWAVRAAQEQGRTPLSDVLSARRAQGVAAGLPIGWA